jgi:hypothetical protein
MGSRVDCRTCAHGCAMSMMCLKPACVFVEFCRIYQMIADASASVGTSSYIVSKSGVEALLKHDKANGFTEAIPNIMALLFPRTR